MRNYQVVPNSYETEASLILKDHEAMASVEIVPGVGLQVIRYEAAGRSVITSPPDLPTLKRDWPRYGIPILFPPNRVKHGTFTFEGTTYDLPRNDESTHHLHGEIGARAWKVIEKGVSDTMGAYVTAQFNIEDHPDILAYFPHPLIFEFTYSLKDGRLHLSGNVVNTGKKTAPLALGFHPYFNVDRPAETEMVIPALSEWPITGNFVSGEPAETDYCLALSRGLKVKDVPSAGYQLLNLAKQANRMKITDHHRGDAIVFETDRHFPFVVVFKPMWAEAVSLEPYTCATDAFNLPYPADLTGVQSLKPSETFSFEWSLSLQIHP